MRCPVHRCPPGRLSQTGQDCQVTAAGSAKLMGLVRGAADRARWTGSRALARLGFRRRLPIIVVRHPEGRVGTTLLMQLLATSEEVVMDRLYPFEHDYLQYLVHFTTQVGTTYERGRDWNSDDVLADLKAVAGQRGGPLPFTPLSVDLPLLQRNALRKLWEAFSETAAARASRAPRYYAEKWRVGIDPLLDAGLTVIPVDLVRDPRDVFASIRAFNKARGFPAFGRLEDQSEAEYLQTRIDQWKLLLPQMNRPLRGVHPVLVRYEEMVADLPGFAARLGGRLGLSLDAARVEADRWRFRQHMTSESAARSVGRWRRDLTASESRAIETGLGPEMIRLGYSVPTSRR